jgi:hypothetical protein
MQKPSCCTEACMLELWPEEGEMRLWNWKHNAKGVLDRGGVLTVASQGEAENVLLALAQKHHGSLEDDLIAQHKEREDYIAKVEAKLL